MITTQDMNGGRRFCLVPGRNNLPRETIERIRGRSIRARFQSLSRWSWAFKFVLFSLLVIGLSYVAVTQLKQLFYSTSYFELKKIDVDGLKTLNRDEVVKLAGVAPMMNILNLDREAVKSRLLLHPTIRSVKIDLEGLYTLKIAIIERTAFMYIKAGTAFLEVADDGVILAAAGKPEKDLPIITGLEVGDKRIGESLGNHDGFVESKIWVKNLAGSVLRGISEFNFSSLQNPYVFLVSGVKIIPRDLSDFRDRYVFLCALLDNLRKNKVEPEYLDLRAPNDIVVRPRKPKRSS